MKINTDFPGGNVLVQKIDGARADLAPDLRGGKAWFYWHFEATVSAPGRASFILPDKVAGFEHGGIGYQGPAISEDAGKNWRWLGVDHVDGPGFFYDFTRAGSVRFSVTIPYLQQDLDAFLKTHAGNPNLATSVLTKSRNGRAVELLQVGKPGPVRQAVLLTARHHACETLASYALEGFVAAAIAETPEAHRFRDQYVLYVVPFVDKDGVEEGDQGKNRSPHDHNRDYGDGSIFPEVDAIEKLADDKNIRFLQDLHCPTLRMKDHQIMYFVGTRQMPANNEANVKAFAAHIKPELPSNSPVGPAVWLKTREAQQRGSNCNRYFSYRKGTIMACTLEIPYAPPGKTMDAAQGRKIGAAMLRAWSKTKFLPSETN